MRDSQQPNYRTCRFIEGFSTIASPLYDLLRKDRKFKWSGACQQAFDILRERLTTAPILAYLRGGDNFILDTDESAFGIGAVLSEVQDGQEKVIAYASKTLSKTQRGYCTTYRELLAAVFFIKHFRTYLGAHRFVLRTDHSSLQWLLNFKDAENMLARWLSVLTTYDFEIVHWRGTKHGNADALSRKPRRCKCSDCPDCLSESRLICAANRSRRKRGSIPVPKEAVTVISNNESDGDSVVSQEDTTPEPVGRLWSNWINQWSQSELKELQRADAPISKILDYKQERSGKPSWGNIAAEGTEFKALWAQWNVLVVHGGLLYRKWVPEESGMKLFVQLVLPKSLRSKVLWELHTKLVGGHLGVAKTLAQVRRRFYWPCFKADIQRWCRHCEICQQKKPGRGPCRAKLNQQPVEAPLERVAIDTVGPLPVTNNGMVYIMVLCDYFSKWVIAYAIPNHTAQTVAD